MKFKRWAFLLSACVGVTAARGEYVRGEINGWTTANVMTLDATFGNIYQATITATNNDASSEFKFDRNGAWSQEQWGFPSGATQAVKNATIGNARYNGGSPGNLSFANQTNGYRYTFRLAGQSTDWFRDYVVMETAGAPADFAYAAPNVAQSTGAVTVVVQTGSTPSPQESRWLRVATNTSFAPQWLVPVAGSGTNYTAAIPGQPAGSRIYFYALSSTMPSNVIAANPDLCALRGLISGATNFSYRAGAMNAWHFPTNAEPSGAYMRNPPTNGVGTNQPVYFYSGAQTGGVGNACNQSGMAVIHRLKGSPGWTTNNANFDSSSGNNAYWVAAIPANTYGATNEVEYFIRVAATDHNTTFIGTTNNGAGNLLFLTQAGAEAAPFRFTYGGHSYNLGNAWHCPTNVEPPGVTMRNPQGYPAATESVFIYDGNQFQGGGNPGDQSGGTLYFRKAGDVAWQSTALVFNAESGDVGNNKYWRGRIPAIFGPTNAVEYYLAILYTDHDATYLGTTNQTASFATGEAAVAQAHPFRYTYSPQVGTAAAFMWHNDNRVVLQGSNAQFWVKIGYAQGIGTNRYVDFASVYYTVDGGAPAGAYGVGTNAGTSTVMLQFDHMEQDSYVDGDAMWWVGTASNLPSLTTINYKIGAWKDTNSVERFADYAAGTNNRTFSFALGDVGVEQLQVNGQSADYTTTKFFVDEIAGDAVTVTVRYTTGIVPSNLRAVEVFSNLGRRDFADVDYTNALITGDGIPDGIIAPNGNFITTNDVGAYYRAYPMTYVSGTTYEWVGVVSKAGAYRLTARFQYTTNAPTEWTYFTRDGRRDHAIVLSPRKALDMTLYELNTLTVEATDATEAGRSTFKDLLSAAQGDDDGFDPFNLDYLNYIQANCLWFQPIHPVGFERSENDPATGQPYSPGSPYATRNYWAVNGKMGSDGTEATAMNEFSNFVAACDSYTGSVGTVNVMLDGVFNHTSWDAVFGDGGYQMGLCTNPSDRIGWFRPDWYAKMSDYGEPATFYNSAYDNDFATAPDRGDFGKWNDVTELFFGRYAALVRHNPENNGDYLNEGDWVDPISITPHVIELWRYFANYPEYWLKKTGHSGTNSYNIANDNKGIDGLRCDFGQGLPPQLWEYIINRTRSKKWNFIFMAETLDGGIPGYRSNRHFDILNENLVFQFTQSHISDSSALSYALYTRGLAYNGGATLLNITSHDEVLPSDDPWLNAARYASVSSVAGLPMVFYGQEQGIKNYNELNPAYDGFTYHELNFGKYVPHFKKWNMLTVWSNPPPDSTGMAQWYGRVNWARLNSPALRSRNHRVLATTSGPEDSRIFAVAKWQTPGVGPTNADVVLAFSRFLEHGSPHTLAANTYDLKPVWNELGLDTGRLYTVCNLASSGAFTLFTNGWPKTGADLYNNGVFVSLGAGTANNITNDGEIVQYLRFVDLGAPNRAPVIALPGPHVLAVGASTNFVVTTSDDDGDPVMLTNIQAPAGASFVAPTFSWTAPAAFENTTNVLAFVADDGRGEPNSVVTNSTLILVPFDSDGDGMGDGWEFMNFATLTNGASGDADGDHVNNYAEFIARTEPTNGASYFRVTAETSGGHTNRFVTIATSPGRKYTIFFANGSVSNNATWQPFANALNGIGTWVETNALPSTYTFHDDEGANTTLAPPPTGQRSYRVTVGNP